MPDTAIKSAIVGFGLSGKIFHAPFMHHSNQFDLVKIVQRTSNSSKKVFPSVQVVHSLQQVIDDKTIELVVIATPNETHFEMACQVLNAGKHLVLEKPFASRTTEAKQLIDLAENKNKHLFVFHNRRWDGDFLTVQHILKEKLLGEIVEYEANYNRFKPQLNTRPWKEINSPSSGVLFDLGTHIIDQAVCLFGRPASVTAHLFKQRKKTRIVDAFDLLLEYPSLKVSLKSTLMAREPCPRYTIYGRSGAFVKYGIDPQEDDMAAGISPLSKKWGVDTPANWGMLNTQIDGLHFQGKVETLPGYYQGFYENVHAVLRKSEPMAVSPHSALVTTEIIQGALASHESGRTIVLD